MLCGLLWWAYLPGTHGPAMLDDFSSIEGREYIEGNAAEAMDYVQGNRSGPLGRPVSVASFALERWLYEGDVSAVTKQNNVVLHLLAGSLLAWLFLLLLQSAGVPSAASWAVLGAGLWMVAPLFVSTVLYSVQRMAMLAAVFSLGALVAYCYWRKAFLEGRFSAGLLAAIGASFLLGLYSKETAITVLPVLVCMELLWLQQSAVGGTRAVLLKRLAWMGVGIGALLVCLAFITFAKGSLAGFEIREFTLTERLLTESRILWDYLRQFFLPDVMRLGVYHDDVVVSKSLFNPQTTIWSLAAWFAVLAGCLIALQWPTGRRLVFCVAFYLFGHSTESTVLPLELYFEHRNYFPMMGIALLVVTLASLFVRRFPATSAPVRAYLVVAVGLLLIKTGSQAQMWSSSPLLRINNVLAHPNSFRANSDMAVQLAAVGALPAALEYSGRASRIAGERVGDRIVREVALACMANEKLPDSFYDVSELAGSSRPVSESNQVLVLARMLQDGRCDTGESLRLADRLRDRFQVDIEPASASAGVYWSLAVLENALGRFDVASEYVSLFLQQQPNHTQGLLMQLHFKTALGKVSDAKNIISQLDRKMAQSQLTDAEQQTLALYRER